MSEASKEGVHYDEWTCLPAKSHVEYTYCSTANIRETQADSDEEDGDSETRKNVFCPHPY